MVEGLEMLLGFSMGLLLVLALEICLELPLVMWLELL